MAEFKPTIGPAGSKGIALGGMFGLPLGGATPYVSATQTFHGGNKITAGQTSVGGGVAFPVAGGTLGPFVSQGYSTRTGRPTGTTFGIQGVWNF